MLRTSFISFAVAAAVAAVAIEAVRRLALRWGLLDQANSTRKIHQRPIPRLGGVGLVTGFAAAVAASAALDPHIRSVAATAGSAIIGVGISGLGLVIVGLVDDVRGTRAQVKLAGQIVTAFGFFLSGLRIDSVTLAPGLTWQLGALALPITVFWTVAAINAVNLIDGMDGLAGGVALIATLATLVVAVANGHAFTAVLLAALAGTLAAFLGFNSHPASIFMGDTGSMFLGAALALVTANSTRDAHGSVQLLACITLLGLPILDITLSFFRRILLGRSPFSADKDHLHHRFSAMLGQSHWRVIAVMYLFCAAFAALGLGLATASGMAAALASALGAVVLATAISWRAGYVAAARHFLEKRARNAWLRKNVNGIRRSLRHAHTQEEIRGSLTRLATILNASAVELVLDEARETRVPASGTVIAVPLRTFEPAAGNLRVVWRDGRAEVDRDEELAVESIAHQVESALVHVGRDHALEVTPLPLQAVGAERPMRQGTKAAAG